MHYAGHLLTAANRKTHSAFSGVSGAVGETPSGLLRGACARAGIGGCAVPIACACGGKPRVGVEPAGGARQTKSEGAHVVYARRHPAMRSRREPPSRDGPVGASVLVRASVSFPHSGHHLAGVCENGAMAMDVSEWVGRLRVGNGGAPRPLRATPHACTHAPGVASLIVPSCPKTPCARNPRQQWARRVRGRGRGSCARSLAPR